MQHLYPLELSCSEANSTQEVLNAEAELFRPKRVAAIKAAKQIKEIGTVHI